MYSIKNSSRKDKKYMLITPENKKFHFGAYGMSDYTIHKDDKRKQLYIARHNNSREDWAKINPGSLSRYILWEFTDLDKAIKKYGTRFKI